MNQMTSVEKNVNTQDIKISASGVQVYYGDTHAIKDVDVEIEDKTVPFRPVKIELKPRMKMPSPIEMTAWFV